VSWKGTLFLALLALLAAGLLLFSQRSLTRTGGEVLLGFNPEKAEKIAIRNGGTEILLVRSKEGWQMKAPLADRADASAIRSLLANASGVTALDLLKHEDLKGSLNLELLELKNPKRMLTITAGRNYTVSFGAEGATTNQLYARVDSDPSVYLIPTESVTQAFRPAEDFRDPRLTALSNDHLGEVTLHRKGGMQELRIENGRQGWRIVTPLAATADREAARGWIESIVSAKVTRWMPHDTDPSTCGLDVPEAVITLLPEGGEALRIVLGSEIAGSPGSRYASCSDRPGICVLSNMGPSLGITPSSLRSKKLTPLSLDAVDRIEIRPSGCFLPPLFLSRKKGTEDWEWRHDGSGSPQGTLPDAQVMEWMTKLQEISAQGFEPATQERLEARGLSSPSVIRFIAHLSENTAEEKAGDMVLAEYSLGTPTSGMTALREDNATDIMIVPESALELTKGPEDHPSK
jgi:hypothetical protein